MTSLHLPLISERLDQYPMLKKYVLSCIAAGTAESATFPLDLIKSRLQVQGEGARAPGHYDGLVATGRGIAANEGFFKLWSGLNPAVIRHFVYSGLRIVIYEEIRDIMGPKEGPKEFSLIGSTVAGVASGAIAQFFASPTDLVKVKLQLEGRRVLAGNPRQYTGSIDVIRQVSREGLFHLWQGWVPNVQRAAIVNGADFVAYDGSKNLLVKYTHLDGHHFTTHLIASSIAGLATAVASTPADVVKTRMMNQDYRNPIYRSSFHCLTSTARTEGFLALYKGFVPIWLRLSPWVSIFWIVYERLRIVTGSPSF